MKIQKNKDYIKLGDLVSVFNTDDYNEYVENKSEKLSNDYLENTIFEVVELDLIEKDNKNKRNLYQCLIKDIIKDKVLPYYINENSLIIRKNINDYVYIEDCSNYLNNMNEFTEKLSVEYLENTKFKIIDVEHTDYGIYDCTLYDEDKNKTLDITIENSYLIDEDFYIKYRKEV